MWEIGRYAIAPARCDLATLSTPKGGETGGEGLQRMCPRFHSPTTPKNLFNLLGKKAIVTNPRTASNKTSTQNTSLSGSTAGSMVGRILGCAGADIIRRWKDGECTEVCLRVHRQICSGVVKSVMTRVVLPPASACEVIRGGSLCL